MSTNSTTELKAVCHCGQLSASVNVPTESFPLEHWLCSCTTCRKVTGHLNVSFVSWPNQSEKLRVQGVATRYASSTGPACAIRCFCSTCGTLVFDQSPDPDRVGFYAGSLTSSNNITAPKGIIYVDDCIDRGLAEWLPNVPAFGAEAKVWGEYKSLLKPMEHIDEEKLHCQCHCGGVSFYITRPGPESRIPPFFLHPLFEPSITQTDPPPPEVKWWIRDQGKKWAALVCMCHSCRQTNGGEIQPWVYVPKPNLVQEDGSLVSFHMGTLKEYKSSAGHRRYFCGTCSATVFFVREGDDLIDVSVGLAEASSGARAEDWFAWTHHVSYQEFAENKSLARELEEGMRVWASRTGKSTIPVT